MATARTSTRNANLCIKTPRLRSEQLLLQAVHEAQHLRGRGTAAVPHPLPGVLLQGHLCAPASPRHAVLRRPPGPRLPCLHAQGGRRKVHSSCRASSCRALLVLAAPLLCARRRSCTALLRPVGLGGGQCSACLRCCRVAGASCGCRGCALPARSGGALDIQAGQPGGDLAALRGERSQLGVLQRPLNLRGPASADSQGVVGPALAGALLRRIRVGQPRQVAQRALRTHTCVDRLLCSASCCKRVRWHQGGLTHKGTFTRERGFYLGKGRPCRVLMLALDWRIP